ncbi:MAG: hypothetical protein H6718_02365 [Polyangiaceae bacterium]|nr:hypothetical protein [Polyangiaceae bacterium]MCB9608630.1 hypothetical protein [Polyangiaceae bacterium]
MKTLHRVLVGLGLSTLVACGPTDGLDEPVGEQSEAVSAPLGSAYCDVTVTGTGTISMEDNYLPHVIQCENGGANLEALKAQAIAARSVAYYNMATQGKICDGQGCQVYSCGATPSAIHKQAVKETAGIYLSYGQMLTYGFYVAGDSGVKAPSCVGSSGSTEHWVTYNEGKSGNSVEQTALGYIGPPGFGQNRGCMSQWGARCLENSKGYDYKKILQFFYGSDIKLLQATGSCITPPEPQVPDLDAQFVDQGSSNEEDATGEAYYQVCAGDPVDSWFEVKNIGAATWTDGSGSSAGQSVRLGVPGDTADPFLGTNRVSVNAASNTSVAPNAKTRFDLSGTAPSAPGVYVTRWQLVDEARAWFGPEMWLSYRVVECEGSGTGGTGGTDPGSAGAAGADPGAGGAGTAGDAAWPGGGGKADSGGSAGQAMGTGPGTRIVSEDGGCSVSGAGSERSSSSPLWLVAALGLVAVRRRRTSR